MVRELVARLLVTVSGYLQWMELYVTRHHIKSRKRKGPLTATGMLFVVFLRVVW